VIKNIDSINENGSCEITFKKICDDLMISSNSYKNRQSIASSFYRMNNTFISIHSSDELSKTWGIDSFSLLPHIGVNKRGRELFLRFGLPVGAIDDIKRGVITTTDFQKLFVFGQNYSSETLCLLLYDVAQWMRNDSVSYGVLDIAQRLGMKVNKANKTYSDWGKFYTKLSSVCDVTAKYSGFLRDYNIEGKKEDMEIKFWFADKKYRRHLIV
jgi:hypothetical protein